MANRRDQRINDLRRCSRKLASTSSIRYTRIERDATRCDAGSSYCSHISDDIALESDALSRQWQSRVALQPTRTNYANEFRTARGGAVVNERLARAFGLHRAQKCFSAERASHPWSRTSHQWSRIVLVSAHLRHSVDHIGCVSSWQRVSIAFFLPIAYCAVSAISIECILTERERVKTLPVSSNESGTAFRNFAHCTDSDANLLNGDKQQLE